MIKRHEVNKMNNLKTQMQYFQAYNNSRLQWNPIEPSLFLIIKNPTLNLWMLNDTTDWVVDWLEEQKSSKEEATNKST